MSTAMLKVKRAVRTNCEVHGPQSVLQGLGHTPSNHLNAESGEDRAVVRVAHGGVGNFNFAASFTRLAWIRTHAQFEQHCTGPLDHVEGAPSG